jgi:hypothetical protein
MEIPEMILEMARNFRKHDILNSTCTVNLNYFNDFSYEIAIIPTDKNVLLKYKKCIFKCKDISEYEHVCKYLLDSIKKEIDENVSYSIEWDGYDPENNDTFDKNILMIEISNDTIFREEFKLYSIPSSYHNSILRHLLPLYYLTINN